MIQDSLDRICQSILVLSVWGRLCLFPGFASCQVCKKIIRSVSCPLGVWVALLCSEKIRLLGPEGLSKYSVVPELVTTCWGTTASRQRPRSRCVHGCCFHDVLSYILVFPPTICLWATLHYNPDNRDCKVIVHYSHQPNVIHIPATWREFANMRD